jgi:serine protease Do
MSIQNGNHRSHGAPARVLLTLLGLILILKTGPMVRAQSAAEQQKAPKSRCAEPIPVIFEQDSPAVVYISATSINPYRASDRVEHTIGSGFIIDAEGLVLTNSHVAFGKQALSVRLDDGTTLPARLLGADPIFDLALLQIPKPEDSDLPTLSLGDSDQVRVGQEMLALGNPLGLDQSLTRGIVSAVNRVIPSTFFSLQEPLIQVDTPINHGNSGGPLLNRCGEVVGITTAIAPDAQNIGFAIPINLAKAVVPDLLKQGHLSRPWLGFHGQFIDENLQNLLKMPLTTGFLVEVVEPGSPAEEAKLQGGDLELTVGGDEFLLGGDIITRLNGAELKTQDDVLKALNTLKVGDDVSLTVFHGGRELTMKYSLPERPLLPGDVPGGTVFTPADLRRAPVARRLRF